MPSRSAQRGLGMSLGGRARAVMSLLSLPLSLFFFSLPLYFILFYFISLSHTLTLSHFYFLLLACFFFHFPSFLLPLYPPATSCASANNSRFMRGILQFQCALRGVPGLERVVGKKQREKAGGVPIECLFIESSQEQGSKVLYTYLL